MKKISSIFNKIGKDPYVDWAIIVSVFFVVAVICAAVSVFIYLDSQDRFAAPPDVSVASSAAPIDMKALSAILGAFDARAADRVLLGKGYAGPSDPSLP